MNGRRRKQQCARAAFQRSCAAGQGGGRAQRRDSACARGMAQRGAATSRARENGVGSAARGACGAQRARVRARCMSRNAIRVRVPCRAVVVVLARTRKDTSDAQEWSDGICVATRKMRSPCAVSKTRRADVQARRTSECVYASGARHTIGMFYARWTAAAQCSASLSRYAHHARHAQQVSPAYPRTYSRAHAIRTVSDAATVRVSYAPWQTHRSGEEGR